MKLNTQRFYEALLRSGIKQKELAEKVGVTEATVSRYVNGAHEPRKVILDKMAYVLKTTTDYLTGFDLNYLTHDESFLNVVGNIRAHAENWTTAQKKELLVLISDFIQ